MPEKKIGPPRDRTEADLSDDTHISRDVCREGADFGCAGRPGGAAAGERGSGDGSVDAPRGGARASRPMKALMSAVIARCAPAGGGGVLQGYLAHEKPPCRQGVYRGTWLINNIPLEGPYSRTISRATMGCDWLRVEWLGWVAAPHTSHPAPPW